MVKKIFKIVLLILAPVLMAFQCEGEFSESILVYNVYKVNVTAQSNFSLNDTIWITDKVSSSVFD